MLKKLTVVVTALLMSSLATMYGQFNLNQSAEELNSVDPAVFNLPPSPTGLNFKQFDPNKAAQVQDRPPYILTDKRSGHDMLAAGEFSEYPFFAFTMRQDTSDTTLFLRHPTNINPETNELDQWFLIPFGDVPTRYSVGNNQEYHVIGVTQVIPAWNETDPDAKVRIDSLLPWMFTWEGAPPVTKNWYIFPFIINPNGDRDVNMVPSNLPSDRRLFDRIFDDVGDIDAGARLQFMDVNGGAGFFEVTAEQINSSIIRNAAGQILEFNRVSVPTPGLEYPAGSDLVLMIVPEDYDQPDAYTEDGERIRVLGSWEWVFQDNPEYTLGGMYRRTLDVLGNPNLNTDVIVDMYNLGLSWNASPVLERSFPYVLEQRIKFNLDIGFFGEYSGEQESIVEWPWQATSVIREDESGRLSGLTLGQVFPNPAVGLANIPFSLDRTSAVQLQVMNILGEVVYGENRAMMAPGSYVWDVETNNFPEGTYIYTMTAGGQKFSGKMTVMR